MVLNSDKSHFLSRHWSDVNLQIASNLHQNKSVDANHHFVNFSEFDHGTRFFDRFFLGS